MYARLSRRGLSALTAHGAVSKHSTGAPLSVTVAQNDTCLPARYVSATAREAQVYGPKSPWRCNARRK
jgi:hypothetical protein